MKGRILGVSLAVSLVLMAAGCGAGEKKIELNDQKSKISYGIGMSLGTDFKAQGIEIDPDVMVQAIKDVTAGGKTLMTEEEVRKVITDFQKELAAKQEAKAKEGGIKNQKDGEAFLAENSKKEGVVTLPSGFLHLQVMTHFGDNAILPGKQCPYCSQFSLCPPQDCEFIPGIILLQGVL